MFTKPRLWFATNTTASPLLLRLLSAGTAHPTLPSQRQAETWFSLKLSRQCQQKDLTPCTAPQGSHMCTSADPDHAPTAGHTPALPCTRCHGSRAFLSGHTAAALLSSTSTLALCQSCSCWPTVPYTCLFPHKINPCMAMGQGTARAAAPTQPWAAHPS